MAVRYATRFRERQRRRDIVPIGGGDDGGAQEGGRWLLQYEPLGWATDFLSETPSNRVALRTASVITEYAIDDFFTNPGAITRTVYDDAGVLRWSPHNLCLHSQAFDNANWTKQAGVTVTPDAVAAPDGSLTADQIDWGSAGTFSGILNATSAGTIAGAYFTYGLWIRSAAGSGDIELTDAIATVGITTATIDANWKFVTLSEVKSGTNWALWLRRTVNSPARIYVWGAQMNRGTSATMYLPTTTVARYGMATDYHPTTHEARGLRIEPQATNRVLQSAMGRPGFLWVGNDVGAILTTSTEIDPSGGYQAIKVVTANTGAGIHVHQLVNGLTIGTVYTGSMWLKGTPGQQVFFNANANLAVSQVLVTFTGQWQRMVSSFTAPDTAGYIAAELTNRAGGGNLPNITFHAWGAQLEANTVATSHIQTLAASATRPGDDISASSTSVGYGAAAGSWWVDIELQKCVGAERFIGNGASVTPMSGGGPTSYNLFTGTAVSKFVSDAKGRHKIIAAFKTADRALTADGLSCSTDALDASTLIAPAGSIVRIGSEGAAANNMTGWMRQCRYTPRRPSNAEMQAQTAPLYTSVGGERLLEGEANGLSTDFQHTTDAQRVSLKTAGAVVSKGVDDFYQNLGTSPKLVSDLSTGFLVWSPHNLVAQSKDAAGAIDKANVTITVDVTAGPLGDVTADQIVFAGANNSYINKGSAVAGIVGVSYCGSVWLKSAIPCQVGLRCFSQDGSGTPATSLVNVTSGWQRFSLSCVAGSIQPIFFGMDHRTFVTGDDGLAKTIIAADWQINRGTSPTAYLPTTTGARMGCPVDGGRGLLAEPQATNIASYSQELDNPYWTKAALTILPNSSVAPDGTFTADKAMETATVDQHVVYRSHSATEAPWTWSVYAKAAERSWLFVMGSDTAGNKYAWFNVGNGTLGTVQPGLTAAITPAGNGWYRCEIRRTLVGPNPVPYYLIGVCPADNTPNHAGDASKGLYLWGLQFEASLGATSYIPNYTLGSVTRAADDVGVPVTAIPIYNPAAGTFWAEAVLNFGSDYTPCNFTEELNSWNTRLSLYRGGGYWGVIVTVGGVHQCVLSPSAADGYHRVAGAWAVNDFAHSLDGAAVITDTSGSLPTVDVLKLGRTAGGVIGRFWLQKFYYLPRRKPNTELQDAAVPPVPGNVTAPVITGTAKVGQTLTANSPGTWTNNPTSYTYVWYWNATDPIAVGTTYTLVGLDIGGMITCRVQAVNAVGNSVYVASNALGPVVA